MSCDPNYVFSIDNHDLTVIETDGINTKPLAVDSIQIFAAQRYSFVVSFCLCLLPCLSLTHIPFLASAAQCKPERQQLLDPGKPQLRYDGVRGWDQLCYSPL